VLGRIIEETRARLAATPYDHDALERAAAEAPKAPDAMASLGAPGVRIIAEVKRRSPSAGDIRVGVDPTKVALAYERAGAAAVSVLTEPVHFGGSLDDLRQVTAHARLPALRKDFIVSRRQLLEARAAGASLVLLIVAGLEARELEMLMGEAMEMGLTPLVETHTADEVRRATEAGATLIGINSRDLVSLEVDLAVAESLRGLVPSEAVAVAESGIHTPQDLGRLRDAGFDVFLIGSALMRSDDPGEALARLLEAA